MFRGNNLWEGSRLVLPEHRAAMIEAQYQEERRFDRPDLDEEKLSEMSQVIGEAMREGRAITLVLYEEFSSREIVMLPWKFDEASQQRVGVSRIGDVRVRVGLKEIIDVRAK